MLADAGISSPLFSVALSPARLHSALGSYARMKKVTIGLLTILTAVFALAADTNNVSVTMKRKRMEFSSDTRAQIAQRSVDLLTSCGFMEAKPKWGAPAEPQSMTDARKQAHLDLIFSSPRKVEVPTERVTLQVRELVITLPLTTAGIWVRTDDGISYFAMFDHPAAEQLQKLLGEAKAP